MSTFYWLTFAALYVLIAINLWNIRRLRRLTRQLKARLDLPDSELTHAAIVVETGDGTVHVGHVNGRGQIEWTVTPQTERVH